MFRYTTVFHGVRSLLRTRNSLASNLVGSRFSNKLQNFRQQSTGELSQVAKIIVENSDSNFKIALLDVNNVEKQEDIKNDSSVELQKSEGPADEFGRGNFMALQELDDEDFDFDKETRAPTALERCDRDISDYGAAFNPTFNFASYANESSVIQELIKLGVELHKVEEVKGALELIMKKNFSDLEPYIRFLVDCGVSPSGLGKFITKNPMIFKEDIDDLKTRIRYLRAHRFGVPMIARIVTENPSWLSYSTAKIDDKLGYFQRQYKLNGYDVRYLAVKQPRIITYKMSSLRENYFAIREEMGFSTEEIKTLLLRKPRIFMKNREKIVKIFNYVHNKMKIPHCTIFQQPNILTTKMQRLKERHQFLRHLGKAQYDREKPLYISLDALVSGTDEEFCKNVAKTKPEIYDLYLKTL